jgi:hypothetical protein
MGSTRRMKLPKRGRPAGAEGVTEVEDVEDLEGTYSFKFPLRGGKVTVSMSGLPADITAKEVNRLKNFLLALVPDDVEEVPTGKLLSGDAEKAGASSVELLGGS